MKRFIKKVAAAVLTAAMLITGTLATAAGGADVPQGTPLRQFFENAGAQVRWAEGSVIVTMPDGGVSVFVPGDTRARINSVETQLTAPVVIVNGRAMISAGDAALLSGQVSDLAPADVPPVGAVEFAGTVAMAQATAAQVMEQMSVAGMTMALVDAQTGFTWTQGFGMADTNNNLRADADTLFQIGSISKPITAIAVMQLVEQGLVDLDSPLVRYIPEFSLLPNSRFNASSDDITVRMLLNNTSGVPTDWMRGFFTGGYEHYQGGMNNILEWLATRELGFVPGSMYDYANNNWVLLGILVARVMGHDNYFEGFVEFTEENVFAPLGMTRSSYEFTSAMSNAAMPHIATGVQQPMQLVSFLSAGSVQSSANDMARLMHFILGGQSAERILSQETVSYMLQNQTAHIAGATPYGFGFVILRDADGFETVGHSGGVTHYFSDMIFNVENGLGVFVSTNSTTGIMAVQAVANAVLQTALMEKTGSVPRAPVEMPFDPNAVPVELSYEETLALAVFEGLYSFGFMGMYDLALVDGQLIWSDSAGVPEGPLVPLSDGSFLGDTGRYVFEVSGDDVSVTFFIEQFGAFPAERINVDDFLAPANFNALTGVYYFVPAFENDVSTVLSIEVSLFRGMAMMTRYTPAAEMIAAMMGGVVSGTQMIYDNGDWFIDDFRDAPTPIMFSVNAQGESVLDFMGGLYVRR